MFASPDEKNLSPLCISPSIKQGLGGRPVTENSPALSFKNGYFNFITLRFLKLFTNGFRHSDDIAGGAVRIF